MANDAITTVNDLLNEEKWTRATIDNYSRKNFIRLDNLIEQAAAEGSTGELRELCMEHYKHDNNSIISLYIVGVLNYERNSLDNAYLGKAITLFRENKKWAIVEFLAEKVLNYEENKKALKALSAVYEHMARDEERWKILERLVRVEHSDCEIPRKIADHYAEENRELAIYYYKITLKRHLMKGHLQQTEEIWRKLAEMNPEDLDFFFSMSSRMADKFPAEKTGELFMELLPYYMDDSVDNALEIRIALLKTVLGYDDANKEARTELVNAFRQKYAGHSMLEETLTLAAIDQTWRPYREALDLFENNIQFDVGDFVYHRSWKIGKITAIEAESFTIDFDGKQGHKMGQEMALKSLSRLAPDHLWIMARNDMENLQKMAKEDHESFLRIVLNSFGKEMVLKDMKEQIIDSGVLTAGQWTAWWNKAKKVFKTNPSFGTSPEKKNVYFLREKPMSLEEDSLNRFEESRKFETRLEIFDDFLNHCTDYSSAVFQKMLGYFSGKAVLAKEGSTLEAVESILFLHRLKKQLDARGAGMDLELPSPEAMYQNLSDPAAVIEAVKNPESRKTLLQLVRRFDKNWPEIYQNILNAPPASYDSKLLDELTLNERTDIVQSFLNSVLDHYREMVDRFVWLCRIYFDRLGREDELDLKMPTMLSAMLNTMARLNRDIQDKTNLGVNRRRFNTLHDLLFQEGHLLKFIERADSEDAAKVVKVIPVVLDALEEQEKELLFTTIRTNHPELALDNKTDRDNINELHPFLATTSSMEKKQAEYKHLVDVEIPENSKDIALAVEKGDLSENAEYKAALEHQEQLKAKVALLDDEIKQARIFAPHEASVDRIGFGNTVYLRNLSSDSEESITILGKWDSDPSRNIISYKSPFGEALLFKAVGDEFEFGLEEEKTSYRVERIEIASQLNN